MENVDTLPDNEYDDEGMFLSDVIQDEHELLLLDSYLREALIPGMHPKGHRGVLRGVSPGEESTI